MSTPTQVMLFKVCALAEREIGGGVEVSLRELDPNPFVEPVALNLVFAMGEAPALGDALRLTLETVER